MKLSRKLTGRISWVLDNLVPPLIRDAAWFVRPGMKLLFGRKADYFMAFKERAPLLDPEALQEYYRQTADVHLERVTDLTPECVHRIIDDLVGETVLDIACGRGYLAGEIARRDGRHVTGIDFSVPDQAHDKRITFLRGTIEQIDFPAGAFDTVVSAHTLEHVIDLERAIAELRRVARRRLIIVVPRQRNYRYTFDLHLRFFQYPHDLLLAMRNPKGEVRQIGNDFYYREDLS